MSHLQWAWEDLALVVDRHLTVVINTPAQTIEGLRSKLEVLHGAKKFYGDADEYIEESILEDIGRLEIFAVQILR
jgi:hypothetical protein